jgi:hypothetical protein
MAWITMMANRIAAKTLMGTATTRSKLDPCDPCTVTVLGLGLGLGLELILGVIDIDRLRVMDFDANKSRILSLNGGFIL